MRVFYPIIVALAAATLGGAIPTQSSNKATNTTHVSPARKYSYAVVNSNGSVTCSGTWNSSEWDSLRKRSKETLLYVRKDEVMYVIDDKPTIDQVLASFKPLQELGKSHPDAGKDHGQYGEEMAEYGRQMGELAKERARLHSELGNDPKKNDEISAKLKKLAEKQHELSKKMAGAGQNMKGMGAKFGEWGKKMGAAAKEADEKATKVIDGAFQRGLAKKI
jgi:hypothetical protein